MQKNYFVAVLVSFLTSLASAAHLMTPNTCFPCIFAKNIRRSDNSLDTLLAIATASDLTSNLASSYLQDWPSPSETSSSSPLLHAKEAAAVATARRLVRCRHARSASPNDKNKRRDLNLCHFKICNMGRKRTARIIHNINAIDERKFK